MTPFLAIAALVLAADPAPPLQTATPKAELGEVRSGLPLSHAFELRCSGSGPLEITEVVTGCGCTKTELSAKKLQAGETSKLTVNLNTLAQPDGAATWPVRVIYKTEAGPGTLELQLSATVVRAIRITPPRLAISTSTTATQTITVEDRRAKPFDMKKATVSNPGLTIEIVSTKEKGGVRFHELSLKLKDELAVGQYAETVTLQTNDSECPTLEIPATIHKRSAGDLAVVPSNPAIRFATGQAEASALVQLRAGGKSIRIAKVECATPGATAKFSEEAGSVGAVRISINAAKAGASGTGEITVHLAEPTAIKLVVPFTWYAP